MGSSAAQASGSDDTSVVLVQSSQEHSAAPPSVPEDDGVGDGQERDEVVRRKLEQLRASICRRPWWELGGAELGDEPGPPPSRRTCAGCPVSPDAAGPVDAGELEPHHVSGSRHVQRRREVVLGVERAKEPTKKFFFF